MLAHPATPAFATSTQVPEKLALRKQEEGDLIASLALLEVSKGAQEKFNEVVELVKGLSN